MAATRVLRWSRAREWLRSSYGDCAWGESSQQCYLKRLNHSRSAFGIAFDIDGVLIRGSETIGRAPDALQRLHKDVENGELLVPYVFLTNGGGTTEAARALLLTRQLSVPVKPIQILLGHTPFKSLAKRYRSKRVLAVGKGDPAAALTSYGFPIVVKMDSYCEEFQHIDPLQDYKPWVKTDTTPNKSLGPINERQIAAVFVCSDPVDWGRDLQLHKLLVQIGSLQCFDLRNPEGPVVCEKFYGFGFQVLCDVLRAGGYPGHTDAEAPQPPIFFAADDFEYSTKFPVPRFGMGAFRIALENLYVKLSKSPLVYTSYGKPKPIVYHLAGKTLNNIATMMSSGDVSPGNQGMWGAREEDPALKTLYMIGDNPESDIAGAIGAGRPWFSILVRSGNFRGSANHDKYPADIVVNNVYEAVDFILKKEGVSTE